jgi:hypothetical protein
MDDLIDSLWKEGKIKTYQEDKNIRKEKELSPYYECHYEPANSDVTYLSNSCIRFIYLVYIYFFNEIRAEHRAPASLSAMVQMIMECFNDTGKFNFEHFLKKYENLIAPKAVTKREKLFSIIVSRFKGTKKRELMRTANGLCNFLDRYNIISDDDLDLQFDFTYIPPRNRAIYFTSDTFYNLDFLKNFIGQEIPFEKLLTLWAVHEQAMEEYFSLQVFQQTAPKQLEQDLVSGHCYLHPTCFIDSDVDASLSRLKTKHKGKYVWQGFRSAEEILHIIETTKINPKECTQIFTRRLNIPVLAKKKTHSRLKVSPVIFKSIKVSLTDYYEKYEKQEVRDKVVNHPDARYVLFGIGTQCLKDKVTNYKDSIKKPKKDNWLSKSQKLFKKHDILSYPVKYLNQTYSFMKSWKIDKHIIASAGHVLPKYLEFQSQFQGFQYVARVMLRAYEGIYKHNDGESIVFYDGFDWDLVRGFWKLNKEYYHSTAKCVKRLSQLDTPKLMSLALSVIRGFMKEGKYIKMGFCALFTHVLTGMIDLLEGQAWKKFDTKYKFRVDMYKTSKDIFKLAIYKKYWMDRVGLIVGCDKRVVSTLL